MEYLILYFIFALATALAAHLMIIKPALKQALILLEEGDPIYDSPRLTSAIMFISALILAPIIFIIYISSSKTKVFHDSLVSQLTGTEFRS